MAAALLLTLFGGSSCSTLRYLTQATRGQFALIQHARPIPEVLKDEKVSPRIKRLLEEIPSVKSYAESVGIKPTKNYRDYVQLDRSSAVWVWIRCWEARDRKPSWAEIMTTF